MKIGLVSPYDLGIPGGVQQIVIELARHLGEVGEEVVVVGPGEAGDIGVPFISAGPSVRVRANGSKAPVGLWPSVWWQTMKALGDCDVVHVHEPFIPLTGWAALALRSRPTVVTFHADPPRWTRRLYKVGMALGRLALGNAITTVASPVAATAIPNGWATPRIIPNAIDVTSYRGGADRVPLRVGFLGRDEQRKGLSVLLEAWPQIITSFPDAELLVMGGTREGAPSGVQYLGRVDEATKKQVLPTCEVFVAPNLGGESFGISVAEAMAAGCAVVASDLPAFRHVVGEAGTLFEAGNSHELANRVTSLLGDPSEARRLGTMATNSVNRFDWDVVVGQYRDTYQTALDLDSGSITPAKE